MDEQLAILAERILSLYHTTPAPRRILVAIAGVPGSGKSVLAYPLIDRINQALGVPVSVSTKVDEEEVVAGPSGGEAGANQVAICVGLDGWHYTRAQLDLFPDPGEARRRRGAAFTFDAPGYVAFVRYLRETPSPAAIPFPTFSHALKDPVPSPFLILPSHRIVVIEGLYSLVDLEPWRESVALLDERVWVECPPDVARERLVRRHIKEGVEETVDKARERVDGSDMINGQWIRDHLTKPTFNVSSVEDVIFADTS